jgi:hypothetical protein
LRFSACVWSNPTPSDQLTVSAPAPKAIDAVVAFVSKNTRHQRLDASTNEDQCRVRNRNAVWVLGMFRRLAVSLFAEWRSRDPRREKASMTDFQSDLGAEHAAPAMRFITSRYPTFKIRS